MKPGIATKQTKIAFGATPSEPQVNDFQRATLKSRESERDMTADFLIGALLYSLFMSGNVSEMLPDDHGE